MALLQADTEGGRVEGVRANYPFLTVFRGIPFVAPPVGIRRWRAPESVIPWTGVHICNRFAPTAIQPAYSSEGAGLIAQEFYGVPMPQSEDCLYLNVWTPANSAADKLPVAVYFHGGAHTTGLSYLHCFDGEGFCKRGVIFVTIPYRIGVFGCLAHPDLTAESSYGSSGNYGYLDQIAALRWVQRNIQNFGGDPDNISIFGQSAGADSVRAMCMTPLTRGIFKRAILQSGGGLSSDARNKWTVDLDSAEELGRIFFKFLSVKTLTEARSLSAEALLDGFVRFGKIKMFDSDENTYAGGFLRFNPIMHDGYVFPKDRSQICLEGEHADIAYILGSTADEWPYMTTGNLAFAENQLLLKRNPAWLFYFSYVPPGAEAEGAHHSVEHHYVFQTLYRSIRKYRGFDFDLSNELSDRWSAFFRTGNPNCENYAEWTPYTSYSRKVLHITKNGNIMEPSPVAEKYKDAVKRELKL